MRLAVLQGTRPEIVKMSPVIKELIRRKTDFFIIHTGQHYSYELDNIFYKQLKLPKAKYNLEVGSHSACTQTAKMILGLENVLNKDRPDLVLVLGDTNSTFAGAFVANKLHIKLGHIEAGLRSYDKSMPEEINRVLVDHISDLLFAPTKNAQRTLISEQIPHNKIFMVGNTIVDAVFENAKLAWQVKYDVPSEYFLATLHRAENVDNKERFESIVAGLKKVSKRYKTPIIIPLHPHSVNKAQEFGIDFKGLNIVDSVGYLTFLKLESKARLILTDSGGIQEEAVILQVPCVTLRDNTERPETLEVGANILAGVEPENIIKSVEIMLERDNHWQNPFGDGKTSEKIIDIVNKL
jgi:UDP-N-acetylglucosamine 2-epimerase (non-hydrolysing)